jgi:serine protease Do
MCAPAVFCITTYDMNGDEYAQGSGFFIDADGTAVTNCHVLENTFSAVVETTDGKSYTDISVLAYDFDQDVAVLEVNGGSGFSFLELGDPSALAGGETVYAIGNLTA